MNTTSALNVLLVEDQPADAGLVTVLLRVSKAECGGLAPSVTWVRTLAEARSERRRAPPDVILLDLNLPDSSGIDTVGAMRGLFPRTPIVVLTADDNDENAVRALEAGAQDHLVKGEFNPRDLARALRHALARGRLETRLHLQEIALAAAPSAIVISDAQQRILWANPAFSSLTGFSSEEVVGRTRAELNGTPDEASTADSGPRRRKDGSRYHEKVSITPVQDASGHLRHYVMVFQDVSAQKRTETLLASVQDVVLIIGRDGMIQDRHIPSCERLGLSPANPLQGHVSECLPTDVAARVEEALAGPHPEGGVRHLEFSREVDGEERHFEVSAAPLVEDGVPSESVVVIIRDVSQRLLTESSLRIAAAAFESQECMMITDARLRVRSVNQAFTRATGLLADEIVGRAANLIDPRVHDAEFQEAMWDCAAQFGSWQGEVQICRRDAESFPVWLSIAAVRNRHGAITDYVCAFSDITDRKLAEERIRYLAYYDMLTHLPNRRLLIERLKQALLARRGNGREGALLFIDLDHFKNLNDTLGHDTGDTLLKDAATRIQSCVRDSDTVARLGGDEFVVMLEALGNTPDEATPRAAAIAEKIHAALNAPYHLLHQDYHISPSIGVTMFFDLADTVDELLKRADLAMYQAKAAGRNTIRFFNPEMQASLEARSMLETDLRHALAGGEFVLHYQAQVDRFGRVIGAEALLRWIHPMRGAIPPDNFIPIAEDTGIILPLGAWVLHSACMQLARWASNPATRELTLSVNVSVKQFRHPGFVDEVLAALATSAAPADQLKLELTESLLLDDLEVAIDTMHALKAHGVRFSLDDFGTGYSSLSYLKRLPLEQLKIDKSFVRDILTDPNDEVISRTIVALAHSLGLSVIAEGVETPEQCAMLVRQGCEAFQGYLFARPVSAADFDPQTRALPG